MQRERRRLFTQREAAAGVVHREGGRARRERELFTVHEPDARGEAHRDTFDGQHGRPGHAEGAIAELTAGPAAGVGVERGGKRSGNSREYEREQHGRVSVGAGRS